MDANVLAELERLEKAATPGPWCVPSACVFALGASQTLRDEHGNIIEYRWRRTIVNDATDGGTAGMPKWPSTDEAAEEAAANMKLMSLLRTHAPALLSAAREAERLREALLGLRRNGPDGVTKLECWCDSERGWVGAIPKTGHAPYCAAARAATDARFGEVK